MVSLLNIINSKSKSKIRNLIWYLYIFIFRTHGIFNRLILENWFHYFNGISWLQKIIFPLLNLSPTPIPIPFATCLRDITREGVRGRYSFVCQWGWGVRSTWPALDKKKNEWIHTRDVKIFHFFIDVSEYRSNFMVKQFDILIPDRNNMS